MTHIKPLKSVGILALLGVVAGCGGGNEIGIFRSNASGPPSDAVMEQRKNTPVAVRERERRERGTIWDLFDSGRDDPNVTVEVNKYLWNASLDVLSFLPIEAADPFSGVIVTGYGTPPGGGRAYRATIYVQDPALDARSLTVALNTRAGPASPATVRAIENAILTRARQLRVRDSNL